MTVDFEQYDAEQVRLMGEMCIVVDENDRPIRGGSKKECHLMSNIEEPHNLLHRAFSVFIFTPDNKLLLQQRADEKITFPGFWTNTCCSHPLMTPEETVEKGQLGARTAAVRKLEHELGITGIKEDELQFLTRIHYKAGSDGIWGEHEIDYIFIYRGQVTPNCNPNEVKDIRYVSKAELEEIFQTAEERGYKITPWFRLIVREFLYKWWDRLDDLKEFQDDKIWKLV
ncbi:isopentenyl-diphosphate delta-isomerase idi1 [Gaertneriomyces sp. JEL0708]|nr:isopentenyl-diphosphate delta-isomerase idi1 [Gaertneriomyces sp. JEL0708]